MEQTIKTIRPGLEATYFFENMKRGQRQAVRRIVIAVFFAYVLTLLFGRYVGMTSTGAALMALAVGAGLIVNNADNLVYGANGQNNISADLSIWLRQNAPLLLREPDYREAKRLYRQWSKTTELDVREELYHELHWAWQKALLDARAEASRMQAVR